MRPAASCRRRYSRAPRLSRLLVKALSPTLFFRLMRKALTDCDPILLIFQWTLSTVYYTSTYIWVFVALVRYFVIKNAWNDYIRVVGVIDEHWDSGKKYSTISVTRYFCYNNRNQILIGSWFFDNFNDLFAKNWFEGNIKMKEKDAKRKHNNLPIIKAFHTLENK